ncbi:MAG: FAD-binding protein [Flammeovirgaceae bacterium]|nr:FAD-binding protein [Flammeovirgaceae bacterium]
MSKIVELKLRPEEAFTEHIFQEKSRKLLGIKSNSDLVVRLIRRSIDARGKSVVVRVQVEVVPKDQVIDPLPRHYPDVRKARQALIIGAGPAGLFAALRLIELGIKPIILERGKDVQSRRRDIANINKHHIVNPDSNYCFGEGGAGTYSDGKLYTRSTKRGDIERILRTFVSHGASQDVLVDAHPHIGTNKLPRIIQQMRATIMDAGGEIHFNTRCSALNIINGEVVGIKTGDGSSRVGDSVILATGHSARDIFEMLASQKIEIEAKPFALGVRVEHHQDLIDQLQYHCEGKRGEFLPASSYSLVHQSKSEGIERGVFSFCMCPGGFIVPSATSPGEVVVNGMSPSRRDSRFANSGIVVTVQPDDFKQYEKAGPLAGVLFQASVEQLACKIAGNTQRAPATRLFDFVNNKVSSQLLETSYQPGLESADMDEILPSFITTVLRDGFVQFGKKMKGYLTNDAQIVGVESRTSSPVRIPRDKGTLEHIKVKRLFPCGEGAGYAGGIVSAAMDGERCADAAANLYFTK